MKVIYKSIILFALQLFVFNMVQTNAQQVVFDWGEGGKRTNIINPFITEKENSALTLNILGEDDAYYYALRTQVVDRQFKTTTDYYFERYDLSHKLIKSVKLSLLTPNGKTGTYENIYSVGDKCVLFFSYWDTKQDANLLYATTIDKEGNQGTAFVVDKQIVNNYILGKYSFVSSPDNTSLLIVRLDDYHKKLNRKMKFIVLNKKLENAWEKDVMLTNNDEYMKIEDCVFDEMGNIFLLHSYKQNKDEKKLLYNIVAYNATNDVLENINISYSKLNELDNMNIFFNSGKLSFIGFYYAEKNVLSGIFSGKMNKETFEVEAQNIEPFHKDTIEKYFSKQAQARALGVRPKYTITDVVINKDGSLRLITENRAQQRVSQTVQGHTTYSTFYAFIEFMIIKLDANGKIEWTVDIPKYQFGHDERSAYGAYLMSYDEENIYLLYNDNPKNILLNSKKNWRNDKGLIEELNLKKVHNGGLMKVTVSSNGKAIRELYKDDTGKNNIVIRPYYAKRMKDGRFWIIGEDEDLFRYGFMKFN